MRNQTKNIADQNLTKLIQLLSIRFPNDNGVRWLFTSNEKFGMLTPAQVMMEEKIVNCSKFNKGKLLYKFGVDAVECILENETTI